MSAPPHWRVVVAVPARDEAQRIGTCLDAIATAAAALSAELGPDRVVVDVVVAADTCLDDTAALVRNRRRELPARVVEGQWRSAGGARDAAVRFALAGVPAFAATRTSTRASTWVANTDADSVVRADWLVAQLAHAERGVAAVAGVVELDPHEASDVLLRRFRRRYRFAEARHDHVHAANFGIRADVLLAWGGWDPTVVVGEDHDLRARLATAGVEVLHALDTVVTTSARLHSHVDGGFASTLRAMAAGSALTAPLIRRDAPRARR